MKGPKQAARAVLSILLRYKLKRSDKSARRGERKNILGKLIEDSPLSPLPATDFRAPIVRGCLLCACIYRRMPTYQAAEVGGVVSIGYLPGCLSQYVVAADDILPLFQPRLVMQ